MSSALALVLATWLLQPTAQSKPESDTTELTRLESVWNEAHLRGDAEALERLWADDLVVFVPRMTPLTKAGSLAFVRGGRMPFRRYETSEVAVRVYGASAVVTGRLLRSREIGGRSMEDDWRFTKVYVRQSGAWRVVSFHASATG